MGRRYLRNSAKKIIKENKTIHPSLRKVDFSKFINKVKDIDVSRDSMLEKTEEANRFTILIKSLQMSEMVKVFLMNQFKLDKENNLVKLLQTYLDLFAPAKHHPEFIKMRDTLIRADNRVELILESINPSFNILSLIQETDLDKIRDALVDHVVPFVLFTIDYYSELYQIDDAIFKDMFSAKKELVKPKYEELNALLYLTKEEFIIGGKTILYPNDRSIAIANRLLNINHDYTSSLVNRISNEINDEVNDLLEAALHTDKQEIAISIASNHFYRLLEVKATYLGIYKVLLTREHLKYLFRACYYSAIYKLNDWIELPKELEELIKKSETFTDIGIIKYDKADDVDDIVESHLENLFLISRVDIPTVGNVLNLAVKNVLSKVNGPMPIDEFKMQVVLECISFIEIIKSNKSNRIYRSTYYVDIDGTASALHQLCLDYRDGVKNSDALLVKLFKEYELFRTNKFHFQK